jgi:nuclear transport factor 2 (NTF2) superfamily protein
MRPAAKLTAAARSLASAIASINDLPIKETERKFRWDRTGPRPTDHSGLSQLNL